MRIRTLRAYSFLVIFLFLAVLLITFALLIAREVNLKTEKTMEENLYTSSLVLRSAYEDHLQRLLLSSYLTAVTPSFIKEASNQDTASIRKQLEILKSLLSADMVMVLSPGGSVIASSGSASLGEVFLFNGLIDQAVITKLPIAATEVILSEDITTDRADLLLETRVRLIPTLYNSKARADYSEDGLAQIAIVPIIAENGTVGVLVAADLLNRDYSFPKKLQQTAGLEVSIYQSDFIIATTTTTKTGNPFVGVMMPENVAERTIRRGVPFVGRVYTSNAWSRAVYLPLLDHTSRVVGALSFSISEEEFRNTRFAFRQRDITQVIAIITLIALSTALAASVFISRKLVQPIERLRKSIDEASAGDFEQGVSISTFAELNDLAKHYNLMIRIIRSRLEKRKVYGRPPVIPPEEK